MYCLIYLTKYFLSLFLAILCFTCTYIFHHFPFLQNDVSFPLLSPSHSSFLFLRALGSASARCLWKGIAVTPNDMAQPSVVKETLDELPKATGSNVLLDFCLHCDNPIWEPCNGFPGFCRKDCFLKGQRWFLAEGAARP